jgi:hypothetical protein
VIQINALNTEKKKEILIYLDKNKSTETDPELMCVRISKQGVNIVVMLHLSNYNR